MGSTYFIWLCLLLSISLLVFGRPFNSEPGETTPAKPRDELTSEEVRDDQRPIFLAKKSCSYGTGILFCQNTDEEDEESQYESALEQFYLEWFGR
ncbi:hypothetical protein ACROYT_G030728 [Oculina patagonica]